MREKPNFTLTIFVHCYFIHWPNSESRNIKVHCDTNKKVVESSMLRQEQRQPVL